MTSTQQLSRIVGLVAELTRRDRQGSGGLPLQEAADRFATTPKQIEADLRTLTLLGDDPEAEWLLSLRVWQEGDRVAIRSGGPFQRPIRFTGDELMAMQLGLTSEQATGTLSAELAALLASSERATHALAGRGRISPAFGNLLLDAIGDRRKVEIRYAGERSLAGINRIVHPYQLLEQEGASYLVAWCELAGGWRHFRLDRILDVARLDQAYSARSDFVPAGDSFHAPREGTDRVEVRFSPAVSRWLKERYPEAVVQADGGVIVTYLVASPEWLVRHVLQYGPEAEVVGPASYRELMRKQLV